MTNGFCGERERGRGGRFAPFQGATNVHEGCWRESGGSRSLRSLHHRLISDEPPARKGMCGQNDTREGFSSCFSPQTFGIKRLINLTFC